MTHQTQKQISLAVTTLIYSALLFWWLAISVHTSPTVPVTVLLVLTILGWVALTAFALALINSVGIATTLILSLAVLLAIIGLVQASVIIAAAAMLGIVAVARWRIRDELDDCVTYQTIRTFYAGVRWLLFGLMVAIAGLALSPIVESLRAGTIDVPEAVVHAAIKPVEPLLQDIAPGYTPAVLTITTDILNQYVNTMTQTNPLLSALVALVTVLLIARLLTPLLAWPTLALIALLVLIARRTKFAHLIKQATVVEQLQL